MRELTVEFVVPQSGLGSFLGAVAMDGRSYVCEADQVVAREEESGKVLWVREGAGDPLELVGGQLLCSGRQVSLLNAADGSVAGVFAGADHRCRLVGHILVDERVDGTRGIVSGRTTDRLLWSIAVGSNSPGDETFARRVRTGIAADGRHVYFGLNDGVVMCVQPESGEVVWSSLMPGLPLATLRVTRHALHLLIEGRCIALNKKTGRVLWDVDGGFGAFFRSSDSEEVVLWNGGEATELANGKKVRAKWLKKPVEAKGGLAEPFVALPEFYLSGSGTGWVLAFDRRTGGCIASLRPKGGMSTKIGEVSMAVGKGRIYYRDWSKRLYCLRAQFLDKELVEVRSVAGPSVAKRTESRSRIKRVTKPR